MKLVKSEDAAESEATIDKIISLAKEDPEIQKIQDYYRKELIKNHGFPESHLDTPQKKSLKVWMQLIILMRLDKDLMISKKE